MAKLIECKICGNEISAKAKSCPHCGHKRGGMFGKIMFWGVVGMVGIGVIGVLVDDPEAIATVEASPSVEPDKIYKIGDSILVGDYSVTINSVMTRSVVGAEFFEEQAAEGGIFVVIDYSYRNDSIKPKSAFSIPGIKLRDSNGINYSADIGATGSYATESELNANTFSDINPGIVIDDAVVFEVSQSSFNAGGWSIFIRNGRHEIQVPIERA